MILYRIYQDGTVAHQDDFWEYNYDFYDEFEVPEAIIEFIEEPFINELNKLKTRNRT